MDDFETVQDHIRRYFVAVHGKNVWFRAPETFNNMLERWMLGILNGESDFEFAEECMTEIENHFKELKA